MYYYERINNGKTNTSRLARLYVRDNCYRVAYIRGDDCCIAYNYPDDGSVITKIDLDGVFDHHYRADCIKDAAQRIRAAVAATD